MWVAVPVVSIVTPDFAPTVTFRPEVSPLATVKSAPAIVTSARANVAFPSSVGRRLCVARRHPCRVGVDVVQRLVEHVVMD